MELTKCLSILKNATQEEKRIEEKKDEVEGKVIIDREILGYLVNGKRKEELMERDMSFELERAGYRLERYAEEEKKDILEDCRRLMEEMEDLGKIEEEDKVEMSEEYDGECMIM